MSYSKSNVYGVYDRLSVFGFGYHSWRLVYCILGYSQMSCLDLVFVIIYCTFYVIFIIYYFCLGMLSYSQSLSVDIWL